MLFRFYSRLKTVKTLPKTFNLFFFMLIKGSSEMPLEKPINRPRKGVEKGLGKGLEKGLEKGPKRPTARRELQRMHSDLVKSEPNVYFA